MEYARHTLKKGEESPSPFTCRRINRKRLSDLEGRATSNSFTASLHSDTYLRAIAPFFLEEELLLKLIIGIILVPRLQELKSEQKKKENGSFTKTSSLK